MKIAKFKINTAHIICQIATLSRQGGIFRNDNANEFNAFELI
jgi:hypothetical protein